ncbi:hypothetical protein PF008_g24357 [Phytophthora fragariae]|uniref:Uncharacterized protein n=1 Tax=Phytophthora fragariae TaxID=53985 RepID=A0A6G0QN42_9STRA|nr:hypothetical protein PF008_g24357 [Phytophthora fragariae]
METVVLAAASSSVDIGPALLLLLANNEHRERPERSIIPSNRFVLSSKSEVNCVKDFSKYFHLKPPSLAEYLDLSS